MRATAIAATRVAKGRRLGIGRGQGLGYGYKVRARVRVAGQEGRWVRALAAAMHLVTPVNAGLVEDGGRPARGGTSPGKSRTSAP